MKLDIAIYDRNSIYVKRLAAYAETSYSDEFTLIDGLTSDASGAQVVLATEELMREGVVPKGSFTILLHEKEEVTKAGEYPVLFRYQPADRLLREVRRLYVEMNRYEISGSAGKHAETVLFLSPAGGVGTSTVAFSYALRQAHRGKQVIYLDLQRFSAMRTLGLDRGVDFSEVSYAVKMRRNLEFRLGDLLREDISGVRYFGEAERLRDMLDFSREDVKTLVEALRSGDHGDVVVIDADCDPGEDCRTLVQAADRTFLVSDGSECADYKVQRFLRALGSEESRGESVVRMNLIYNRFDEKYETGRGMALRGSRPGIRGLRVCAEFPDIPGKDPREVAEELGRSHRWEELEVSA